MSKVKTTLTVAEAAKKYQVGEQTLRNWIKEKKLPILEYGPGESGPQHVECTVLEDLLAAKGKLMKPEVKAEGDLEASTEIPPTALPPSAEVSLPLSDAPKAMARKKRKRSAKEPGNPVKYVKNQMRKFTGADLVKIRDWILHRLDAEILGTKPTKS